MFFRNPKREMLMINMEAKNHHNLDNSIEGQLVIITLMMMINSKGTNSLLEEGKDKIMEVLLLGASEMAGNLYLNLLVSKMLKIFSEISLEQICKNFKNNQEY